MPAPNQAAAINGAVTLQTVPGQTGLGCWRDTLGADFSAGTLTNLTAAGGTTVYAGGIATQHSIFITPTNGNVSNNDFETQGGSGSGSAANWFASGSADSGHSLTLNERTTSGSGMGPNSGTYLWAQKWTRAGGSFDFNTWATAVRFLDSSGNIIGGAGAYGYVFLRTVPAGTGPGNATNLVTVTSAFMSSLGIVTGQLIRIQFWSGDAGSNRIGTSSPNYECAVATDLFAWSGQSFTFRYAIDFPGTTNTNTDARNANPNVVLWGIDTVVGGLADYSGGGNIKSRESPAISSNPNRTWSKVTISADMSGGGTLALSAMSYATSGTAWSDPGTAVTLVQSGSGANATFTGWIPVAPDKYLRYKITLTGGSGFTPIVKDVTIEYFGPDNFWMFPIFTFAQAPTTWGNLDVTAFRRDITASPPTDTAITWPTGPPSYLTIQFYFRTAAAPNGPWTKWTQVTPNATIPATAALTDGGASDPGGASTLQRHLQLIVKLATTDRYGTVDSGEPANSQHLPIIEDVTVNANMGVLAARPTAVWWKRRYHLSVQHPSFSYPSHIHALSRDRKGWTLLTGLAVGHFCEFRGRLFGCRATGTFAVLDELDVGGSDAGAAIEAKLRSRDEDFGAPYFQKDLVGINLSVQNRNIVSPNASGLVNVKIYRDGVLASQAPVGTSGATPNRIPISVAPVRGHQLGIEISHTRANEQLEIHSLAVEFKEQRRAR